MPDDVAMHEPCTWVVGLETDDGVTWCTGGTSSRASQHGGVTSGWVVEVQGAGEVGSPGDGALAEDRHVVTV